MVAGVSAQLSEEVLARWAEELGPDVAGVLVDSFLLHTPARIEAARALVRGGALDAAREQVHLIVGSAGNLGADRLAALAQLAQQQALGGDVPAFAETLGEMATCYPALARRLAELRAGF